MPDVLTYSLDDQDRIVRVNETWTQFALENDAPELAAPHVLQQSIWAYVHDSTTRQIYTDLLARVRAGTTARFPLRCDSPTQMRELTMVVSPASAGGIDFATVVVAVEPRSARLWDRAAIRDDTVVRSCAWCKKVDVGGTWMEVQDALEALAIFRSDRVPSLTHGICDACRRAFELAMT